MYENNLPYQSESVFHFPAKTMFKFSTSTTQTFVFKFFFSQIQINLLYILRKRRKVYQDRSCQSVYYGFTILRQARQLLYYSVIEKNSQKLFHFTCQVRYTKFKIKWLSTQKATIT